jgi:hypothetical protein
MTLIISDVVKLVDHVVSPVSELAKQVIKDLPEANRCETFVSTCAGRPLLLWTSKEWRNYHFLKQGSWDRQKVMKNYDIPVEPNGQSSEE